MHEFFGFLCFRAKEQKSTSINAQKLCLCALGRVSAIAEVWKRRGNLMAPAGKRRVSEMNSAPSTSKKKRNHQLCF